MGLPFASAFQNGMNGAFIKIDPPFGEETVISKLSRTKRNSFIRNDFEKVKDEVSVSSLTTAFLDIACLPIKARYWSTDADFGDITMSRASYTLGR